MWDHGAVPSPDAAALELRFFPSTYRRRGVTQKRYPAIGQDPRELRSKRSNRIAALALVAAIIIAIGVIALFG